MVKVIRGKKFDTAASTIVRKHTYGAYGDPAGFETTLYLSPDGNYFLYTFGGAKSSYAKEKITPFSKEQAQEFINNLNKNSEKR